jgi:hypothetical protein
MGLLRVLGTCEKNRNNHHKVFPSRLIHKHLLGSKFTIGMEISRQMLGYYENNVAGKKQKVSKTHIDTKLN